MKTMFKRELQAELIQMAREYSIVTLIRPRQAGKTTLVQTTFPNKPYLNLESPEIRQLAELDPNGLLAKYPDGAILDEIQRVPELLSYLQVRIDQQRQNGLFILTGSHQLALHTHISQSLAGRTAILHLLPLSLSELKFTHSSMEENEQMLSGFLPRIYQENQQPTKAYRNYLQTYVERDVRLLINIGKRLTKTPKLYFVEVGLAACLLGIESVQHMQHDPLRGHLFENMVVLELLKARYNQGLDPHLFFYRDQYHKVDLIYQHAQALIPIEIKSSQTFISSFTKGLDYFSQLFPTQCSKGYVIYAGEQSQQIGWKKLINYQDANQLVKDPEIG